MAEGRLMATTLGGFAVFATLIMASPVEAKYASLVMDAKTGTVLEQLNADARTYPASLTKMMTLYLTFESLEQGRLQQGQRLGVSAHAVAQRPSKLDLSRRETITVEQAILALTVKSANDAAVVLAEAIAGSEPAFAQMMTQKARELGMRATVFRNASGLPNPGQVTTARDMATLARALIRDYPQYYHYFNAREFTFQGYTIPTHNHVLTDYVGAVGLKTGYSHASGFILVTSAMRDGRRLIGVVMGGQTSGQRDHVMIRLLDNGFATRIPVPEPADTPAGDEEATRAAPKSKGATEATHLHPAEPTVSAAAAPAIAPSEEGSADEGLETNWGIQVGAYGRSAVAQQTARRVQRTTPSLENAVISISHVRTGGAKFYRARLVGLSESQARHACAYIHHHKGTCMLVVPDADRTVAQVSP